MPQDTDVASRLLCHASENRGDSDRRTLAVSNSRTRSNRPPRLPAPPPRPRRPSALPDPRVRPGASQAPGLLFSPGFGISPTKATRQRCDTQFALRSRSTCGEPRPRHDDNVANCVIRVMRRGERRTCVTAAPARPLACPLAFPSNLICRKFPTYRSAFRGRTSLLRPDRAGESRAPPHSRAQSDRRPRSPMVTRRWLARIEPPDDAVYSMSCRTR